MNRNEQSLTRRTVINVAVGIGTVLAIATLINYWYVADSLRRQALEQLQLYVNERGVRESNLFLLAEVDLRSFGESYREHLWVNDIFDPQQRFDELFEQREDGSTRLRQRLYDEHGISGIIGKQVEIDASIRRRLVAGYDLLRQYGPAWRGRNVNLYITLPENAVLMYWPEQPWGLEVNSWEVSAKLGLNANGNEVLVIGAGEVEPPTLWSNLYFDYGINDWMLSATDPMQLKDGYRFAANADILLSTLFERTIHQRLEGTYNIIFRHDGHLVTHPHFMEAIQAQSGNLSIQETDNFHLKRVYNLVKANNGESTIINNAEDEEYLAVTRLQGPNWYFVTIFPKAIISKEAAMVARMSLLLGACALLLGLGILYLIFRRKVAKPLGDLVAATDRIAAGDFSQLVDEQRSDEIGHLTRSINVMAGEIKSRETSLIEAQRDLEQHVAERTLQLREAKDQAEAANRAKSAFLANMSHELRTPLNAILGFSQLSARDPNMSAAQRENLDFIQRSGEHLLELINDVLELSKVESGRSELIKTPFNLHELLRTIVHMIRLRAEEKGLQLSCEHGEGVPIYIKTDERKLRQVLINLLSNAVKFTDTGHIIVHVSGIVLNDERCRLCFEVEDTGSGIAEVDREKLFEAFVQTGCRRHTQEGTGLGLPISRQFVRLLGGDIEVTSESGMGSIFRFTISAGRATAVDIQPEQRPRRVIGLQPGQPEYRILIIEDKFENRILLRKMLEPVGFAIREAEHGQQGVELFESWAPQLIWMDIRMPMMNGYEATRRIKASVKGRSTVIIALTASAFEEQRLNILSAGCDDFVRKPLCEHDIFDKMAQHLGARYIYEKPEQITEESGERTTPAIADLSTLPRVWIDKLHGAAIAADSENCLYLLQEIGREYATVAAGIKKMVDKFEFDRLLRLLEKTIRLRH
ncbi:MAG: response regulator [bacterium]|nr:response regulator [bacterium]